MDNSGFETVSYVVGAFLISRQFVPDVPKDAFLMSRRSVPEIPKGVPEIPSLLNHLIALLCPHQANRVLKLPGEIAAF